MRVVLTVLAGPHKGLEFVFDRHDTFLVGRSKYAHFQLPAKDRYFSRIHFMMEVNPPQCRLVDMGSHNGTYVNGEKAFAADLKDGDQIRAGHTILKIQVQRVSSPAPTVEIKPVSSTALPAIPGYVLERELGRGVMGTTYAGQQLGNPSTVAIKVVQPSFQGTPTQVDDFLRSARFLSQLHHPNIVPIIEVGVCPDGIYFVSEFVPGMNTAEILEREGPIPIKRAVRWTNQLLPALQYAHGKHFVHRDIKPSNVLVTQIGGKEVAMLNDFALARVYQAAPFSGLSLTTALLNLASFVPPEMLFNFQEINPLADQYSLAAVLYHVLTGAPVLEMPKEEKRRYSSLLRRPYVPIRERRDDVPAALADVIHKALSRSPAKRFEDCAAFRQALIRAVQDD